VNKLRNAPASIIGIVALGVLAAGFNFLMGLFLALSPETFVGIDQPDLASGAPSRLVLVAGVACIAYGFVYVWGVNELIKKSDFAYILFYTLSSINILIGLFRLPLGLVTIFLNLLAILLMRAKSSRQWLRPS
jgi:hypothetical protein